MEAQYPMQKDAHQPMLSPETMQKFGRDSWSAFLEHSPLVVIECTG
jgi:hypothetical protein